MDALLIGLLIGLLVGAGNMTLIAFRENRLRRAAEFRARTKSVGRRELAQMRQILDLPR